VTHARVLFIKDYWSLAFINEVSVVPTYLEFIAAFLHGMGQSNVHLLECIIQTIVKAVNSCVYPTPVEFKT
jgi:hypothetical protein